MPVSMKPEAQRIAERLAREAEERRQRRRAAADEAERTRVPDRVKPTRQTVARLQPDPLLALYERGTLKDTHLRAALSIRKAFIEVGSLAMASSMKFDGGIRVSQVFPREVEDGSPGMVRRREYYRRWAAELGARLPDAVSVTIDVVVDGRSLRQVDAERRWRNGRASNMLVEGLHCYAVIAGWEQAATDRH